MTRYDSYRPDECSNQIQLYLNDNLINFSCELGPLMTTYDFLDARRMILNNF